MTMSRGFLLSIKGKYSLQTPAPPQKLCFLPVFYGDYGRLGSFEKTLHNFIREGGWRSPKGVDERLVGEIYVQTTDIRFGVGLP